MNAIQLLEDEVLDILDATSGGFLTRKRCRPQSVRKRRKKKCCGGRKKCCGSDNDKQRVNVYINGNGNTVFVINDNDGLIELINLLESYAA